MPIHTIRDDGTLRFDPHANTLLSADTILVEPEGTFEMGTDPTQPDPLSPTGMGQRIDADKTARVVFTDSGPIDTNWDPFQYSRGLVSHGAVRIFGSTVTSFEQLAVGAKAHDKTLVLDATPTGWQVGDRLILTGDTAPDANGVNHDEQVQIVSIALNAEGQTVVTITDPNSASASTYPKGDFNLDHTVNEADIPAAMQALADFGTFQTSTGLSAADAQYIADVNGDQQFSNADIQSLESMIAAGTAPQSSDWTGLQFDHPIISGYVADVTRNATFASQNVTTIAERGHIMFMHNDDVHVDGAGFYGLGRTDKRIPIDDTTSTPLLDSSGQQIVLNGVPQVQITHIGTNPRGRYAVHFHRTGVDEGDDPATISDSAVVDTPGWGIVNHSSNVDVDGNVVFNAVGAAYVTEAGDEIGRFDGNIAIHSVGSGGGIDDRIDVQDFGHEGNGFWLQGGNVSVMNNIVAGQRGEAYVFYALGLNQSGLGVTGIPIDDLVDSSWVPANWPYSTVDVDSVAIRLFKGNIAFASGMGLALRYTKPAMPNVIQDFTAFDVATGVESFYTTDTIFKDVTLIGDVDAPHGTAFANSDVTHDITYDHVTAVGWDIGIATPNDGRSDIIGGEFDDVTGILVQPAIRSNHIVNITGAQFGTLSAAALGARQQLDVDAVDEFLAAAGDVTKLYDDGDLRPGAITIDGQQVYFPEQAADYVPFSSSTTGGVPVPAEFIDKTNAQLFAEYGLTIGGYVVPLSASASNPRINALLGSPLTPATHLQLTSAKYVEGNNPYFLSYGYYNPSEPIADIYGNNVLVQESTPTPLQNGWNLITRTILGATTTLLIYGDNIPPTFVLLSDLTPSTFSVGDIVAGVSFYVVGYISDDSFGSRVFFQHIKLDDPQHVSPVQTDSTGSYINVFFTIQDAAGNATLVNIRFSVVDGDPSTFDPGQPILPPFPPSVTLQALLSN